MTRLYVTLVGAGCAALLAAVLAAETSLAVGPFSQSPAGGLPPDWKPLVFEKIEKHTDYQLVRDGERVVVRAQSQAGASGLIRDIRIDPREYPVVRWRWKVGNVLERADLTRKDGDDYPARLYIVFRSDRDRLGFWERLTTSVYGALAGQEPPTGAINYVWDGRAPEGTSAPNAYTGKVQMIVVQSGVDAVGRWVEEERDVRADYRAAFGTEAPPIVGVAIMTDTDNTGDSATAWYGDITFHSK